MKYVVAYLYYDLLNLYGDSGNIKALYHRLSKQKVKVEVKYLSIDDKKEFSKYDLVYIGSGTNKNLEIALNDLMNYKEDIKKSIEENKNFLITGNAIELFGKYILKNNKKIKCLNVLNFFTEYNERYVKDVKYDCNLIDSKIIGFENHNGLITSKEKPLFKNNEGIIHNNFIGTYVIGPLLIRNPEFCKYYIKKLILDKKTDYKIIEDDYRLEELAYKENIESIS